MPENAPTSYINGGNSQTLSEAVLFTGPVSSNTLLGHSENLVRASRVIPVEGEASAKEPGPLPTL